MERFLIGITLPISLQKQLGRLCFGLNHAAWYDPSFFHIALLPVHIPDRATAIDTVNTLSKIIYPPFFLTLRALSCFETGGKLKDLGVSISPSVDIEKLTSIIRKQLQEIGINEKKIFKPHIPLCQLSEGNSSRLEMFLWENSNLTYSPLLISSFALLSIHTTPKNAFYSIVQEFPLKNESASE